MTQTIRRDELVANSKAHYAADILMKGTYATKDGSRFKGCSVGCHIHNIYPRKSVDQVQDMTGLHKLVADHYGYPEWLALLQDAIFEGLPDGDNNKWHVHLAEAIAALPDDVNWQNILHCVHVGILRVSYATADETSEAVKAVLDLHERAANGEDISADRWSAAESAAWSAAESAAWSAARSAAWSAARSAAWSAARSAAWSAAESAAYFEIRDVVLDVLAGAK